MRSFLRDVAIFSTIQVVVALLLFYRYNVPDDFFAALNDKLDRLETIPAPRILLFGGSSVAFGTQSQLLVDAFAREVQNLGHHAGVGLDYRSRELELLARPTDVVVISLEWGTYGDEYRQHPRVFTDMALGCPRSVSFMSFRNRQAILDGFLTSQGSTVVSFVFDLKKKGWDAFQVVPREAKLLSRSGFNEFGDYVQHYSFPPTPIELAKLTLATGGELTSGIDRLNAIHAEYRRRGIRAFYFVPIVPDTISAELRAGIQEQVSLIENNLDFPVLNADAYIFSADSFFDTVYHLRENAARRRTELLISRLSPHLTAAAAR